MSPPFQGKGGRRGTILSWTCRQWDGIPQELFETDTRKRHKNVQILTATLERPMGH
jgi:hypothetical protein